MKNKFKNLMSMCLIVSMMLLSSVGFTQNSVAAYYSLKTATTLIGKNVYVQSFDKYTTNGGGMFTWIPVNNTGITDIAGIRIKPRNNTTGYWKRAYDGGICVDWFGTTNSNTTWALQGITQARLDSIYGVSFANTSDIPDGTAIRYAFKLMETPQFQYLYFSGRYYYISRECTLPSEVVGYDASESYTIQGNSSTIYCIGNSTYTAFKTTATDQNAVDNTGIVGRRFIINGFNFVGDTSVKQEALFLGANYNSDISNISTKLFLKGITLRMALNASLHKCENSFIGNYGILVGNGNWSGAAYNNAQSNNVTVDGCRVFVGSDTAKFGIGFEGTNGGYVRNCIIEDQNSTIPIGFKWDTFSPDVSTTSKSHTIEGSHVEIPVTFAGVYAKCGSAMLNVTDFYSQYPMTLVAMEQYYNGYPILNLSRVPWSMPPSQHKMASIGGGIGFNFDNNAFESFTTTDVTAVTNPATGFWDLTKVGSVIPANNKIRYTPRVR